MTEYKTEVGYVRPIYNSFVASFLFCLGLSFSDWGRCKYNSSSKITPLSSIYIRTIQDECQSVKE